MKFLPNLRKRARSDRGDAILVMSILFIPFMFLITGFAMDLTKAVYVKQQYQIMGQEATSAATRTVDTKGSIKSTAVQQVVNVYAERFAGIDSSGINSGNGDNYSTREGSQSVRTSVCTTVTLPNGQVKQAPYMELSLNGGRNDIDNVNSSALEARYTSEGGAVPVPTTGYPYNTTVRYYAINATVWDTSPNLIMGMFARPCQQVKSVVSSITFGSQEDVFDFGQLPNCPAENLRFSNANTIAWDPVTRANAYRLVSKVGGATVNTYTTNAASYSSAAISSTDPTKTWSLEAQGSDGGFSACGTLLGTAPVTPCPSSIVRSYTLLDPTINKQSSTWNWNGATGTGNLIRISANGTPKTSNTPRTNGTFNAGITSGSITWTFEIGNGVTWTGCNFGTVPLP